MFSFIKILLYNFNMNIYIKIWDLTTEMQKYLNLIVIIKICFFVWFKL